MNLLTKTKPWLAASLLAAASAFGQQDSRQDNKQMNRTQKSFEQGHELVQTQMMAGYNAPARIDVRGAWDFYADAGFTYWQASQDNMEIALTDKVVSSTTNFNGDWIDMNFKFNPGFKVGGGMNFDHDGWDSYAEYIWFRGKTHQSSNGPTTPAGGIVPSWLHPQLIQAAVNPASQLYNTASEKWKLHMDIVNWELARSYYVGNRLSFRPFFGARAAWIRQNVHVQYVNTVFSATTGQYTTSVVQGTANISDKSNSWAVGPRAGLYSNWMVGEGFRIYGNGAADILYTRYTKANASQSFTTASSGAVHTFSAEQGSLGVLRPHMELELGFGWGTYFDNNNWHVDLLAGYTFQVFFDQNMLRSYKSFNMPALSEINRGNLYMQGLTASARFDF